MELKTIKTLLLKIVPKRPTLHILNYAMLQNGRLTATNLEERIAIDTGTNLNGFLDVSLFLKSLSLEKSMCPGTYTSEEFPKPISTFTKNIAVDPAFFNVDLSKFADYAWSDVTRKEINGVHLNPERKEVVATNGHILLLEKLPEGDLPVPLIIGLHTAAVISVLPEVLEARYLEFVEDEKNKGMLVLGGKDYTYTSRLVEGEYPPYYKVIPAKEDCSQIDLSRETLLKMLSALDQFKPFTNTKNHLTLLDGQEIFIYNRELQKHLRADIGERIVPETKVCRFITEEDREAGNPNWQTEVKPFGQIGFNLSYLQLILKEALKEDLENYSFYYYSSLNTNANIGAMTIRTDSKTMLQMPLRLLDGFDADSTGQYSDIPAEYLTIEAPKPKAAKKPARKLDKRVEKIVFELQEKYGPAELVEMLETIDLV